LGTQKNIFQVLYLGDIRSDRDGVASLRFNLVAYLFHPFIAYIHEGEATTLVPKYSCAGPANPGGSTRDYHTFSANEFCSLEGLPYKGVHPLLPSPAKVSHEEFTFTVAKPHRKYKLFSLTPFTQSSVMLAFALPSAI
jgi:hypothetical protein